MSRRTWLALGSALALGLLAYPATRILGRQRPRFPYLPGTLTAADYARLAAAPGWAASSLVVAEGIALRGLVRRPAARAAPWVLFFQGNDGAQLTSGQKFLERLRDGRDWGLAVYAFRGYDSSGGNPGPEALAADGLRIHGDLIEREQLDPAQLHVVAFSLGGYPAIHIVAEAARAKKPVASLSLLASVQDIEMVRPSWAARFTSGDVYAQARPGHGARAGLGRSGRRGRSVWPGAGAGDFPRRRGPGSLPRIVRRRTHGAARYGSGHRGDARDDSPLSFIQATGVRSIE